MENYGVSFSLKIVRIPTRLLGGLHLTISHLKCLHYPTIFSVVFSSKTTLTNTLKHFIDKNFPMKISTRSSYTIALTREFNVTVLPCQEKKLFRFCCVYLQIENVSLNCEFYRQSVSKHQLKRIGWRDKSETALEKLCKLDF